MIDAITLDLDDTLWPIAPVIARAEIKLHDWLSQHCPAVTEKFTMAQMRAIRDDVIQSNPHLHHDFSLLRRMALQQLFDACDIDHGRTEAAFEVFFAARNEVQFYGDALHSLQRMSSRHPIASLSNGNADLHRMGLGAHFKHIVTARQFGQPKPEPAIFLHACGLLNCDPARVAHVGDDPILDVTGAKQAGLFAVWLNRERKSWEGSVEPDLIVHDLHEFADWIEQHPATI